ncbi:MAG: quinol:cytochrome C oxidoreductase, partial [Deltaproteobacteria bacterium]
MSEHSMQAPALAKEGLNMDALAGQLLRLGTVVGVLGLTAAAFLGMQRGDGGAQLLHSYLLALVYFLSLGLGALFFVTLQYLTRAGWSVVVRRIAEVLASSLPLLVVLFVPVLVSMLRGSSQLYIWVDKALVAQDELLRGKQAYLNVPFFAARLGVYFVIWTMMSRHYLKQSVRQDQSGDLTITARLQSLSAPGMALFALSTTFAAIDLLMSLHPHWYSTIFG